MKNIVFAALMVGSVAALHAQSSSEADLGIARRYHLWAGVHLGFGGGAINTVNAEGRKVNPGFNALPAYGISILAPFGTDSRIGLRLDAGMTTMRTKMRPYEFFGGEMAWNGFINETYSHITVAPMLNLGGFLVGAGFNFPSSASYSTTFPTRPNDLPTGDQSGKMATAIDVRLGAQIPAWRSSVGVLSVDVLATYVVNGVFEEKFYYGSNLNGDEAAQNHVPATLRVGASFLFDIAM
jgi:hypothetical protein